MSELKLRGDRLEWLEVDGEVIALEGRRSEYLGVNPSGTLLWRAVAEGSTEDGLARLLVDSYGIDAELARDDAARFVADLRERGLLAST
jgi:Coenzyme PQQ synthesis protein D (PqqD)